MGIINKQYIITFLFVLAVCTISYFYIDRELSLAVFYAKDDCYVHFLGKITSLGKSIWYIVPSLLLFIFFHAQSKRRYAAFSFYVLITNIVVGILVWLIKFPFGRLRPKVFLNGGEYGFKGLGVHYEYVSFPSGHAMTIVATVVALGFIFPKYRIPLYLGGALVALSRIATNSHFLSDVLMGSCIGAICAFVLYKYSIKDYKIAP